MATPRGARPGFAALEARRFQAAGRAGRKLRLDAQGLAEVDAALRNPAEPRFGTVQARELANHCGGLPELATALRNGLARVRGAHDLAFAVLRHAGLTF